MWSPEGILDASRTKVVSENLGMAMAADEHYKVVVEVATGRLLQVFDRVGDPDEIANDAERLGDDPVVRELVAEALGVSPTPSQPRSVAS